MFLTWLAYIGLKTKMLYKINNNTSGKANNKRNHFSHFAIINVPALRANNKSKATINQQIPVSIPVGLSFSIT
jgi:hypothetical protein